MLETSFSYLDLDGKGLSMKNKAILSISIALMIASVSCFAAIVPSNATIDSDNSLTLASSVEDNGYAADSEQILIDVPAYDEKTGTFSTTEVIEMRINPVLPRYIHTDVKGGETKVEHESYFPSTVAGITEHYDVTIVYISANDLNTIYYSAGGIASMVGTIFGGVLTGAMIQIIAAAINAESSIAGTSYPDGVAYAVATKIYVTRSTSIPIVPIIVGSFVQSTIFG